MEYSYIEKRYNVMGLASIEAFAGIKGGMNGNCKDVYFLRALGADQTFSRDVEEMDRTQTGKMLSGQGIYNRVGAFPKNIGADLAARYMGCYQNWLDSGRKELFTLKLGRDCGAGEALGDCCRKVLEVYRSCNCNLNESIEKNFVVKLLFWLDNLAFDYLKAWNPKQSMKFVAQGVAKDHEYLFCYFLTLLGIDVLLLQNEADIGEKMEALHLSGQVVLGGRGSVILDAYDSSKYADADGGPPFRSSPQKGALNPGEAGGDMIRVVIPPGRHRQPAAGGNIGRDAAGTKAQKGKPETDTARTGQGGPAQRTGTDTVRAAQIQNGGPAQRTGIPAGGAGFRRPGGQPRELGFEELALLASSVVMITIHDGNGNAMGSGSGIMIGREGYILTNDHVARGGRYYSVRMENDDQIYRTDEIIKYNSLLDLAVIRIDRSLQPLPVYQGGKPLVRGQRVVAIGSPLGLFNSVSDGIISGFRRMNDVDMIQFTAPISHGSSGGAVLNMFGEVIGVSTAGIDEGQNINLAVGYEFINTFIKGFR